MRRASPHITSDEPEEASLTNFRRPRGVGSTGIFSEAEARTTARMALGKVPLPLFFSHGLISTGRVMCRYARIEKSGVSRRHPPAYAQSMLLVVRWSENAMAKASRC